MIQKFIAILALNLLLLGANAQERMSAELLWKLGRVTLEDVSPDGSTVLYTVKHYSVEDNSSKTKLYKVDVKTGVATHINLNISQPRYIENGERIGGVLEDQYVLADKNLTSASAIAFIKGSNWKATEIGGGRILLLFNQPYKFRITTADQYPNLPKADVRIIEELNYRHWDTWNDEFVDHVHYAIYSPGKVASVSTDLQGAEAFDATDFAASADGKYIAYSSKKVRGTAYATSTNTDIYLYTVATGETKNITQGMMGYDRNPAFSPNGQQLAWTSMPQDGNEADVNKLWILDLATGAKTQTLTEDYVEEFAWVNDFSIGYMVPKMATQQLGVIDFRLKGKSQERIITKGDYNYGHFIFRGKKLFAERQDMNHANEIFSIDLKKGEAKAFSHVNDAIYKNVAMGKIEKRMIKTTDGKEMLTWVIYPPNFDPAKKYPTLLYCQGGPQSPVSQFYSFRWNFQLMAAHDYIIVAPNRRGLQGFGVEWNAAISKDWGGQPIRDYLSAIDEVAKEPFVDAEKLGAVGASYGGYSVYMLAGIHQNRFKAFISHDGVFNTESMYGSTEELFFTNWENDGPYWKSPKPKAYTEFSPHNYAQNWNTPILIIQGAQDFRIPETQAMEAFQAAQLLGVPSKFLLFNNENHWILKPQNSIIWQAEFYGWLDKWLK